MTGGTTVSISGGGTATFVISGGLDGPTLTQFSPAPPTLSGTTPVSWDAGPAEAANLPAGVHTLTMGGTVVFTPAAIGDTLTEDSAYGVSPAATAAATVPVPAAPWPAALALAALLLVAATLRPARPCRSGE